VTIAQAEPLPEPPPPVEVAKARGVCEVPQQTKCTRVGSVKVANYTLSSRTCAVDTQIKDGDVGHVMRCKDGVYIQFPDAIFGGTSDGVEVNTCMRTEFPFSDGCTWETTQRISGRVDTVMRFSYGEHPISGRGCSPSPCSASADLYAMP
jgi:hypothetical protein